MANDIRNDIRRAEPADAEALRDLARETFTETFGHLYAPEDLALHLDNSYDVAVLIPILESPDHQILVAEHEGRLIAWAHGGPCGLPHPEADETQGELKRLYVRQGLQASGLGSRLLERTLAFLGEHFGDRPQWVGVWEENPGAKRLYERQGFRQVGAYQFTVGDHRDEDLILRRPAPVARATVEA